MDLRELLDLGHELSALHLSEKPLEGGPEVFRAGEYLDAVAEPLGDLGACILPCVSFIDEDNSAKVLDMTDDTPDSLIHCPGGLLAVPILA